MDHSHHAPAKNANLPSKPTGPSRPPDLASVGRNTGKRLGQKNLTPCVVKMHAHMPFSSQSAARNLLTWCSAAKELKAFQPPDHRSSSPILDMFSLSLAGMAMNLGVPYYLLRSHNGSEGHSNPSPSQQVFSGLLVGSKEATRPHHLISDGVLNAHALALAAAWKNSESGRQTHLEKAAISIDAGEQGLAAKSNS